MMPFFNLFGMFSELVFTFGGGYAMLPLIFQGCSNLDLCLPKNFPDWWLCHR